MPEDERAKLLALQRALSEEQFKSFKFLLEGLVPLCQLDPATRADLCRLLLQRFPGRALEVTADLLRRIDRHDLVQLYQLPGAQQDSPAGPATSVPPGEPAASVPPGCAGSFVPPGCAGSFVPPGCPGSSVPPGCAGSSVPPGYPPGPGTVPAPPPRPRRLTEKELMQVAQKLGREWQEVGIVCLGLERSRLDQIRADDAHSVVMQSFQMLREWSRRQREEATASRLLACLAHASLDPEVLELLQSFQKD